MQRASGRLGQLRASVQRLSNCGSPLPRVLEPPWESLIIAGTPVQGSMAALTAAANSPLTLHTAGTPNGERHSY